MLKTRFHNKTGEAFDLKEGNAGIYSQLARLEDNNWFDVEFDPSATYREYWVGSTSRGVFVKISSDDCTESQSITIMKDGKFSKEKRDPSKQQDPNVKKPWWKFW